LIFGPSERSYRLFVAIEGAERTAGFDIPNMNFGIGAIASAQQPRSIRAKCPIHFVRLDRQRKHSIHEDAHSRILAPFNEWIDGKPGPGSESGLRRSSFLFARQPIATYFARQPIATHKDDPECSKDA
jgi:hypothetical protein